MLDRRAEQGDPVVIVSLILRNHEGKRGLAAPHDSK
jgi:hypothetical protein